MVTKPGFDNVRQNCFLQLQMDPSEGYGNKSQNPQYRSDHCKNECLLRFSQIFCFLTITAFELRLHFEYHDSTITMFKIWSTVTMIYRWAFSARSYSSLPKVTNGKPIRKQDGFLYAFMTEKESNGNRIYKVGKTVNLQNRFKEYRRSHQNPEILCTVHSDNIHVSEKWVHDILKAQGKHIRNELFRVEPAYLKQLMATCGTLCDTMVGPKGGNTTFLAKLAQYLLLQSM